MCPSVWVSGCLSVQKTMCVSLAANVMALTLESEPVALQAASGRAPADLIIFLSTECGFSSGSCRQGGHRARGMGPLVLWSGCHSRLF